MRALKVVFILTIFAFDAPAWPDEKIHQSPSAPNDQTEAQDLSNDTLPSESAIIKLRSRIADLEIKSRALNDLKISIEQGLKKDPKASDVTAQVSGSSALSLIFFFGQKKAPKAKGLPSTYEFDSQASLAYDSAPDLKKADYDQWRKAYQDFLHREANRPASLSFTVNGQRHTFNAPEELIEFINKRSGGPLNSPLRHEFIVEDYFLNSMAADYKTGKLEATFAQAMRAKQEQQRLEEVAGRLRSKRLKNLAVVGTTAAVTTTLAVAGIMLVNSDNSVELKTDRVHAEELRSQIGKAQKDIEVNQDDLEEALFEGLKSSGQKPVKVQSK